jgi:hypothetical protein
MRKNWKALPSNPAPCGEPKGEPPQPFSESPGRTPPLPSHPGQSEHLSPRLQVESKAEVRGEKPLLQKPSFCRSGFRRDLCVIEDGGLGLKSYLNRSCDEREGSLRPSPIIQRHEPTDFRRGGFRREYSRMEERGVGIEGSPFGNDRRRRGDSGSGLKPLLPKNDPCRTGLGGGAWADLG